MLLAGLAFSFFGLLSLGAALFPGPYDWKYRVISSLASPKDNPHFYGLARVGLGLTGVILWRFAHYLYLATARATPRFAIWSYRLHRIGAFFLVLAAVISSANRWFGWHRLHEDLAELAGLFLGLAFVGWTYGLVKSPAAAQRMGLKLALILLTFFPLGGLLLSRGALFLAYLHDSRSDYEAFKHSLFCSLALWEWMGAGCIYLFLALAVSFQKPMT